MLHRHPPTKQQNVVVLPLPLLTSPSPVSNNNNAVPPISSFFSSPSSSSPAATTAFHRHQKFPSSSQDSNTAWMLLNGYHRPATSSSASHGTRLTLPTTPPLTPPSPSSMHSTTNMNRVVRHVITPSTSRSTSRSDVVAGAGRTRVDHPILFAENASNNTSKNADGKYKSVIRRRQARKRLLECQEIRSAKHRWSMIGDCYEVDIANDRLDRIRSIRPELMQQLKLTEELSDANRKSMFARQVQHYRRAWTLINRIEKLIADRPAIITAKYKKTALQLERFFEQTCRLLEDDMAATARFRSVWSHERFKADRRNNSRRREVRRAAVTHEKPSTPLVKGHCYNQRSSSSSPAPSSVPAQASIVTTPASSQYIEVARASVAHHQPAAVCSASIVSASPSSGAAVVPVASPASTPQRAAAVAASSSSGKPPQSASITAIISLRKAAASFNNIR